MGLGTPQLSLSLSYIPRHAARLNERGLLSAHTMAHHPTIFAGCSTGPLRPNKRTSPPRGQATCPHDMTQQLAPGAMAPRHDRARCWLAAWTRGCSWRALLTVALPSAPSLWRLGCLHPVRRRDRVSASTVQRLPACLPACLLARHLQGDERDGEPLLRVSRMDHHGTSPSPVTQAEAPRGGITCRCYASSQRSKITKLG